MIYFFIVALLPSTAVKQVILIWIFKHARLTYCSCFGHQNEYTNTARSVTAA